MQYIILMISFMGIILFPSDKPTCKACHQDVPYLCASNTLPINSRLCIDITEVPAFYYKDFLQSLAERHGTESEAFNQMLPDFSIWQTLLPKYTEQEIKEKYIESDQLGLMPIVGISLEQAEAFCEWRTEAFKAELAEMSPRDREEFPKDFVFRLPTAHEWARMRFLYQEKKMMKQLRKIAESSRNSFKLENSGMMRRMENVKEVFANQNEEIGFFNILDNVAEMTAEPGIAMGGSYFEPNTSKKLQKTFKYEGPQAWLGIRCIFEIIE